MKNTHSLSRRDFLQAASLLTLSTGLAGARLAAQPVSASASWPVACRDIHLKVTGQPDCWSALKALGATGVEVRVNEDLACASLHHPNRQYSLSSPDQIKQLHEEVQNQGLRITAFCMNNRLDQGLDRELAWTRKLAAALPAFGVEVIRIDVVPHKLAPGEFLPFAIRACKQLCDIIRDTPLRLGIENHGSLTNDPDFLDRLFDGVGSPQLGLTLDPNNFYWFGHPLREVYPIIEKFAARVFHTHCKNIAYPEDKRQVRRPMGWDYDKCACPLYEGDIDYLRIARILRGAKYRGDLCLENECLHRFPADQHATLLKKEIAFLNRLAKAA